MSPSLSARELRTNVCLKHCFQSETLYESKAKHTLIALDPNTERKKIEPRFALVHVFGLRSDENLCHIRIHIIHHQHQHHNDFIDINIYTETNLENTASNTLSCRELRVLQWIYIDENACFLLAFDDGQFICAQANDGSILFHQRLHADECQAISCVSNQFSFNKQRDIYVLFPSTLVVIDGDAFDTICRQRIEQCSSYPTQQLHDFTYCKWRLDGGKKHAFAAVTCSDFLWQQKNSVDDLDIVFVGVNPIVSLCVLNNRQAQVSMATVTAASVVKSVGTAMFSFAKNMLIGDETSTENCKAVVNLDEKITRTEGVNCVTLHFLDDPHREIFSVCVCPLQRYLACTDSFGRVILMDARQFVIVRVWKGYRDAQCAFLDSKTNEIRNSLFLVILVPHRQLLEIWALAHGPRVAACVVDTNTRLISHIITAHNHLKNSYHTTRCRVFLIGQRKVWRVSLSSKFTHTQIEEYFSINKIDEKIKLFQHNLDEICHKRNDKKIQSEDIRAVTSLLEQIYSLTQPSDFHEICVQLLDIIGIQKNLDIVVYESIIDTLNQCVSSTATNDAEQCETLLRTHQSLLCIIKNSWTTYSTSSLCISDFVQLLSNINDEIIVLSTIIFTPILQGENDGKDVMKQLQKTFEINTDMLEKLLCVWLVACSSEHAFEHQQIPHANALTHWLQDDILSSFETRLLNTLIYIKSKHFSLLLTTARGMQCLAMALCVCRVATRSIPTDTMSTTTTTTIMMQCNTIAQQIISIARFITHIHQLCHGFIFTPALTVDGVETGKSFTKLLANALLITYAKFPHTLINIFSTHTTTNDNSNVNTNGNDNSNVNTNGNGNVNGNVNGDGNVNGNVNGDGNVVTSTHDITVHTIMLEHHLSLAHIMLDCAVILMHVFDRDDDELKHQQLHALMFFISSSIQHSNALRVVCEFFSAFVEPLVSLVFSTPKTEYTQYDCAILNHAVMLHHRFEQHKQQNKTSSSSLSSSSSPKCPLRPNALQCRCAALAAAIDYRQSLPNLSIIHNDSANAMQSLIIMLASGWQSGVSTNNTIIIDEVIELSKLLHVSISNVRVKALCTISLGADVALRNRACARATSDELQRTCDTTASTAFLRAASLHQSVCKASKSSRSKRCRVWACRIMAAIPLYQTTCFEAIHTHDSINTVKQSMELSAILTLHEVCKFVLQHQNATIIDKEWHIDDSFTFTRSDFNAAADFIQLCMNTERRAST